MTETTILRRFVRAIGGAMIASIFVVAEFQQESVWSATLASQEEAAKVVSVRNVAVKGETVSGEIANHSPRPVRDVQLLIRYTWTWKNEMRPGEDQLSDAVYYTVEGEIPPGAARPFTFNRPAPLPSRPDGQFEVSVSVAGFTEVIPAK